MFFFDKDIQWDTIDGNSRRKVLARGGDLMVVKIHFFESKEGQAIATHHHPHEQTAYVHAGSFLFTIDGEEQVVSEGDSLYFPSHCEHGCIPLANDSILIDAFSPQREDFLLKG